MIAYRNYQRALKSLFVEYEPDLSFPRSRNTGDDCNRNSGLIVFGHSASKPSKRTGNRKVLDGRNQANMV